jgi:tRNA threonylcarbamoyladenosine biosynthesis protein TsaE
MTTKLEMVSRSSDETHALGVQLGQGAQPGNILLLIGELGAGKTTLTQGIAQGLGVTERPRSPTFVMATEYHGRLALYHLDLYRIDHVAELGELGLEEYLSGDSVTVVEWADRAPQAFPADCLRISLESIDEDTRRVTMTAEGDRHMALLATLKSRSSTVENR